MRVRDRTSALLGCAALLVAILVVGGALRWTQAIVAALVALALIPQLWSRRALDRKSPLLVALGIAAGVTALQLIPLPEGLLYAFDPVGMDLRADGASLLDTSPWIAITLDAPGTLRALAYFLILLGVAAIALRMSTSERGRFLVLAGVTAAIALCALVVAVHAVFAADTLYGLYEPDQAQPAVLGPLLNPNHLGSLMAVGAVSSIGLMLYTRQPSWLRASWVVTLLACATVTVVTLSRGATLALVAGTLVALGVLVGQRFAGTSHSKRRRARLLMTSLPIGVVATCTILVVILLNAGSGVEREFARTSLQEIDQPTSKYEAWKSAMQLVDEAPWVGVGRGAFESAFTRVHPPSGFVTFSHLENEYIQAVVDWGLAGALALAGALLWLAVKAIRRWRDGPLAAAALGGCVVVGLQSNFDFGVELLGLAIPITAIAATLTYVPLREIKPRPLLVGRLLRGAHIALLGIVALLLMSDQTKSVLEDHSDLTDQGVTLDDVKATAQRHPLDYYAYARAASLLATNGDTQGIRLLNHALRLHPTHSGLHRMAGTMLLQSGHVDQAAFEYAAALRATKAPQELLEEILKRFPKDKVANAIPTDFANLDVVIKTLRELERSEVATAWLRRVLASDPKDVRACELLYSIALRENDLGAAEEAGRSCVEIVPDRATRLSLARVLMRKKGYSEVVRLLADVEEWPGRIDEKINAWLIRCDAYEGLANWESAKRCVRQLEVSGYVDAARRPDINKRIERVEKAKRDAAPQIVPSTPILQKPVWPPVMRPDTGSGSSGSASGSASGSGM